MKKYFWIIAIFLAEVNEPNFIHLSSKHKATRVVFLSPMGLPSFVYTFKILNKNEGLVSYKRHCRGKYSMEGKSWLVELQSDSLNMIFSKEFFAKNNYEQEGDELIWIVEQKINGQTAARFLKGENIIDMPKEIETFFKNLPSFVPRIDTLVKERCHIQY